MSVEAKKLEKLTASLRRTVEREEALNARIGRLMAQRADNEEKAAAILRQINELTLLAEANGWYSSVQLEEMAR